MASKQPFKLINVKQTLITWSIRINKFFKHRLLSKRKNVLLISQDQSSFANNLTNFYIADKSTGSLIKVSKQIQNQNKTLAARFEQELINNLYKTWQLTKIKSIKKLPQISNQSQAKENQNEKAITKKQKNAQSEEQPSTIMMQTFDNKNSTAALEKYFVQKKKYFDAIIVLPEKDQISHYPQIQDQQFATTFIDQFEQKMMKNIVAYRYAHKFLNTSGCFIQSTSQYDFLKKTEQQKQKQNKKNAENKSQKNGQVISYAQKRPPSSKQILDNTICYLGVLVGDRDYTDLNSWTLVSLSQQASIKDPEYVAKMYYDWADGQQLPMPGSFTIFKKKIFEDKKELNFVQYL